MKLKELYNLQEELMEALPAMDHDGTLVSFRVELGEFLNEARFFKVWSQDQEPRPGMLEEFVDAVHFLLQIGILRGWTHIKEIPNPVMYHSLDKEELANCLYENTLYNDHDYYVGWQMMLALAEKVGLEISDIRRAYLIKNKVNHERQEEGY